ncbi:3-demethylubiquinone-9 3-methyltransferase [Gammaproteobacteria bacterium]|nr:3-demethylubiquinone-9 3-methyltransferase [Gammaproteobacteria bacterium]
MPKANDLYNVSAEELDKFNQDDTDWWDLEGSLKTLHHINPVRLDFILRHVNLAELNVLDVGCGGGILTEALAKRNAQVTGLDMAENAISIATKHALNLDISIDYKCQSVQALAQEAPATFDVVTCMEMLEHVPDPYAIIQACYDLLKPNGYLFLSTLNRTLKARALAVFAAENIFKIIPKATHDFNKFIKPSELAEHCEMAGFKVCDLAGISYNPFTQIAHLDQNVDMNYLMLAQKIV